ncbi:MAG: hypothetical protein FWC22_07470 [Treponema sp.]|nr:hypothetical protein [Treponema sp.]
MAIGQFLWKISVALYLIANGMLGILKPRGGSDGDFEIIFGAIFKNSNNGLLVTIVGVIAVIAGAAILLEMLNISIPMRDTLIFIIAIIWAVYVVLGLISWITSGFADFWYMLQRLGVHTMVLASLLIASGKFGK